jgi:phosphatidylserine decarboxylase
MLARPVLADGGFFGREGGDEPPILCPMSTAARQGGSASSESIVYFNRYSGRLEAERVYGGRALLFTYTSPLGGLALFAAARRRWFSRLCGAWMRRPASRRDIRPFIEAYGLDPSEFLRQPEEFTSFNDFFIRELKPGARPIDPDPSTAVFPADGRHLGFADASRVDAIVVKGQSFDLPALLEDAALAERHRGGAAVVSRLCPTDYHRFHFPAAGVAGPPRPLPGPLYSVSPIALRRRIAILFENKRCVTRLESERFGLVTIVEIGATCVGSIVSTFTPHEHVAKGAEKGYFQFGGSSMITLFEPGRVRLDADLLEHTAQGHELFARIGDRMGIATGS